MIGNITLILFMVCSVKQCSSFWVEPTLYHWTSEDGEGSGVLDMFCMIVILYNGEQAMDAPCNRLIIAWCNAKQTYHRFYIS